MRLRDDHTFNRIDMMIRFLSAVICGLALLLAACGKDGETLIEGQVVWADDGVPIEGATVSAWMKSNELSAKSTTYNEQSVETDEEGNFRLDFEGDDDVSAIPLSVYVPLPSDTSGLLLGTYDQTQLDCGDPCEDSDGLRPGRTYDLTLRVPR